MDSIAQAVTASCHSVDGDADTARARRIGARLGHWSAMNLRSFPWRRWSDPYRVTVTEVLLQQTAAARVALFVDGWFETYPDWESLAAAGIQELERALHPLGLQRRRASALQRLAISELENPEAELTDRPGVGQYISRAVAVSLDGASEALVDTNFVRILRRAFVGPWKSDYRYDSRLQSLASSVVHGSPDVRAVNWAVLDLAAMTCRPARPNCGMCPIIGECRTGTVTQRTL